MHVIHVMCAVPAHTTVVITLSKLEPRAQDEQISFIQQPTLQEINLRVESLFEECRSEDFRLSYGKERIETDKALERLCWRSKNFTLAVSAALEGVLYDTSRIHVCLPNQHACYCTALLVCR